MKDHLKIVMIGAGRVATNLAREFVSQGLDVAEVWSHSRESAEGLAEQLRASVPDDSYDCRALWDNFEQVCCDADLYIVAVKDAVLSDVVQSLHEGRENALMVHTAGSMSTSVFTDIGHSRCGVFYPMQTFSKERAVDFTRVHLFIEATQRGDEILLNELACLLTRNVGFVHSSTPALRRRLHLAAVFACNFLNHCCTISTDILESAGLDFSALLPLVDETVAKLHVLPAREAQTGPAVRGDDNVIGMHLAMLTGRRDLQKIYSLLTKSIQDYDKL